MKEKPISTDRLARMIQRQFLDLRKDVATKEDLKPFATKEDLNAFATRVELQGVEVRLRDEIQNVLEDVKRVERKVDVLIVSDETIKNLKHRVDRIEKKLGLAA